MGVGDAEKGERKKGCEEGGGGKAANAGPYILWHEEEVRVKK